MDKKIAGQPAWLWAIAAVVVVGGYLYFKHTQSGAAAQPAQPAQPMGQSTSHSTFSETIKDMQSHPKPKKKKDD